MILITIWDIDTILQVAILNKGFNLGCFFDNCLNKQGDKYYISKIFFSEFLISNFCFQ